MALFTKTNAALFARLLDTSDVQSALGRIQDNIAAILNPLAQAVGNTPMLGAPPPPWIPLQLLAGWTTMAGWQAPVCHRDALGYVHIQGTVMNTSGGALGTAFFTLPKGYRPARINEFPVAGNAGAVEAVLVNPNGLCVPDANIPNNGHAHFGGLIFLAEQ